MTTEHDPEVEAIASDIASQELPFPHIQDEHTRALAITLLKLKGFEQFATEYVVGRTDTIFMERPPGTQHEQCGPGTIRRGKRRFDDFQEVCEALAIVLIRRRDVNLDEPHELLAKDFVLKCGGAMWSFKSRSYRTQRRAAAVVAKTGNIYLAAAHTTGQAADFLKAAQERVRKGRDSLRRRGSE